jgi:hypothetical protein
MTGKGSAPRPFSVSQDEFKSNWENTFKQDPRTIQDAQLEDEAFKIIEKQQYTNIKILDNGLYVEYED